MTGFIAWCGFFGGWLLVGGPVYQAAIELREETFEREVIEEAKQHVEPPEPVSTWWWLVPPVYYEMSRRRNRDYQDAVIAELTLEQFDDLASFFNKARGWMIVGMGALLIATKETWELCEHYEWSTTTFVTIWLLATGLVFGTVARRMRREEGVRASRLV
jgi:hypothetical protein